MQAVIQYIEKELQGLYQETEIKGFIRLIVEHVYGFNYTQMLLHCHARSADNETAAVKSIVERLKTFEPLQYILGETEFYGLKLKVNPSVLIPRPETEELVHWILNSRPENTFRIMDIGTGSGCIAIALKNKMPDTRVTAIDISAEALKTAKRNAADNNLDVDFIEADIFRMEKLQWAKFDVIVSNPPYVREAEKAGMAPNVLNYEPASALFVPDANPLVFYQAIASFAKKHLTPDGSLFFEINEGLAQETVSMLAKTDFRNIETRSDINGKPRMIRCTH